MIQNLNLLVANDEKHVSQSSIKVLWILPLEIMSVYNAFPDNPTIVMSIQSNYWIGKTENSPPFWGIYFFRHILTPDQFPKNMRIAV